MPNIPPPPAHGPYDGVPMGDPAMDPVQIIDDLFDDRHDQGGAKRNNNKTVHDDQNANKRPCKHYEGYALERLKPTGPGESITWARCGRQCLPYSQDQLVDLVKRHRKATGIKSADPDLKRLSSDKRGIITRIIDEKKLNEKSKTAEWTLVDVQTIERRIGWSREIHRLQVVIKRVDKGNDKNGYSATGAQVYPADDIIDLTVPLEKKKDKAKDKTKRQSRMFDPIDPLGDPLDFGPRDLPPNDQRDQQYRDQQHHGQHQQDLFDQQMHHEAPPPPPFPPGWQPNPFDPSAQFHQGDPHVGFPGGARAFNDTNPFFPQQHIAAPGQYNEPLDNNRKYIHPHNNTQARARTCSADRDRPRERSRSQRRRPSSRRASRDRRRDSQRRRDDSIEDIRRKLDRLYPTDDRDSNSSNYDERSLWSRSEGRYDRSPDTSVYSDDWPPRDRNKRYHRNSDPRPRYRSSRYRDADYQPEYTTRPRDRRVSPARRPARPALMQTVTYDDYPIGRAAEPRYLPAPPQRRLTDAFGEKRDPFEREFRRYGRAAFDRVEDPFEAGMRVRQRRPTVYHD